MTEYLCSASRHLPASQAIASLTHPQAPASAGDVSSALPRQYSGYDRLWASEVAGTTDYFDGSDGNVAIKREQRLLADYAEHKQREECKAGLIMEV